MSPEIGGSAYEDSANVGMTDLVAALKWVHENIANFGGDPDRVMIYGQSGGGSKVTTLMGMPSAAGLFHRAAAQSGGGGNIPSREQQRELARQVMKDLGLAPNDIGALQKMEWPNSWRRAMRRRQRSIRPAARDRARAHRARRAWVGRRASMARSSTCDRSSMPRPRSRKTCRC